MYKIKKYWQIFLQLQKINVMRRAAYPSSFFFSVFAIIVTIAFSIIFVNVNFGFINNLAGWTYYQALAVIGSYMIIESFLWAFTRQLNNINNFIKEGSLDGILLKPIDDQFLATFWSGDLEDLVRFITGICILFISVKNTIGFNFVHIALFILLLVSGCSILYGFNLLVRSFSFWFIEGSGLWLFMERVTGSSQYPIDIYYNKFVRGFFTFIIPLAFVATVPAKILTNINIDWKLVAMSFFVCLIFLTGSRWFWKFSLKHYSSASS